MSNQSPEDFVKNLPVVTSAPAEIATGETPLPQTAFLSEFERARLGKLAANGEQPVERAPLPKEEELTTYPDGSVLKFFPRKGFEPQCLLIDATGKAVAIAKDENIADWFCNACNLMLIAALKANAAGIPLQIFHKPVVIPSEEAPGQ